MSAKRSFFILLLIMLITGICGTAEATTSWLPNYSHRVVIPVNATAAGAQTDYQMQIVLHSKSGDNIAGDIYLNGNLQDTTNFNDIRFTASDGTTLKDFWIQKVEDEAGGRKATVYVELDTPASGSTDYYLYYGKSGDTSASNYDNTFTKDYGESGLAGLWHIDTSPGPELLTDGGLETWVTTTDLTNWIENATSTERQILQESTTKQAGSYSVKLLATANDGTTDFGIHQDITTVNNEKYQINFYQKYSSRTQGTLKIEAYDSTNSVSLGSQSITATSTSFSFVSFRFTSTNTTNVRIKVYLNDETTGTVYIDALSVKQSSATLTDSSGNPNTGTIYGASRTDTDGGQWDGRSDVRFSTGSALQFDGVNDYVDFGDADSLIGVNYTYEFWINPSSNQGDLLTEIFSKITGDKGLRFLYRGSAGIWLYADTGYSQYISNNPLLGTNTWNHLVIVVDGSTMHFRSYLNGVLMTPSGDTAFLSVTTNNAVARLGYKIGSYTFNGLIDEVRIYNRALSADEISRHYIRSKYASPSPIWATPETQQAYALAVITQSATYIGLTSATLNGYLSGFGGDTSATVYFKWGLSQDDLNHTTASQVFTDHGSFSQPITDLSSDTTYYFQTFVENSSETAQGSIVSFKTDALETDYYGVIINTDGSLTFTNKGTAAAILSSAPSISLSYLGHSTVSNGNNLDSTLSIDGDFITITSVDDTNPYAQITHQYQLNTHSPYINYTVGLQYKQDVFTTEERFDFVVPSRNAQVMTRDLKLVSFNTSNTYWSDIYTPKVVRFTNGLSFLGSDTMESMRLRTSGINSQISFYSDYGQNHPHFYYIKNGWGATTSVNETQRTAGDTYSASVTFAIDTNESLQYLVKTRQPYGYDATLTLTNHPDSETLARIKAVAYGTENESDPSYGTKGIAARGIGWTKAVFVSGQTGADLQNASFKSLIDQMYQDGVVIVGHSITPYTDSRAVVAAGLATLSQYNSRGWIDHSASGGTDNWEDLASQGAIKGSGYYILDLLDQYNYQYAWSYIDLTTDNRALNMLKPSATSDIRPFLFYNNRVDGNVYDNKKIYLWSTINTNKTPDYFYTNDRVNTLISERGVHIAHEYYGYYTPQNHACENHAWYNHGGTIEIYPTFDSQLEYIAGKQAAGLLWSPPRAELGDYLVPLKDVLVTYNSDGTITVTNNSLVDVTGITLLTENNIQSVTIDNYDLVSFGDSYGDKEMVLPTIVSGDSVVLNISYGAKDSSVPTIASNDTGKNKVNEITGYWDDISKILTMTAEGRSGDYSFTATIPSLANRTIMVKDVTINTIIGEYRASGSGAITFTASLGSLHTFKIIVEKPFVDNFDSYGSDGELQNVWHPNPTLVWLNTDPNFVCEGNSMKYEYEEYAEVEVNTEDLPYQIRSDWTVEGVKALVLYFYGDPCNSILPMYVKLIDGSDNEGVVTYGDNPDEDPNYVKDPNWHEWNIDLAIFDTCGVDLTDVEYIYLGFGEGNGSGTVYFDDIRLYPPRCILSKRSGDFAKVDYAPPGNPAGDCVIDYQELEIMADYWLMTPPPDYSIDLNGDGTINFRDFAVLVDMWLEEQLWP